MPEATLFHDARATLGESPFWDAEADELVWCDISAGLLHRTSADGAVDRTRVVAPPLASIQPGAEGGLVAALADRIVRTDDRGRILRDVARVDHAHDEMRLNEGKCDPFGAFVVGAMDESDRSEAGLYRVEPNGRVALLVDGLGTANGIEFTDDGSVMWVTDTDTSTIYRGSYGPSGLVGSLKPFATGHAFDGLVRDSAGEFWSAENGAGRVLHLSTGGEVLGAIDVAAPAVSGITIGGAALTTLFICSAREDVDEEQLAAYPLSGGVFAYALERPGRPARAFG